MTSDARFSLSTPIYYINDAPHLGHAYTTVACDALARYQRMRGRDVWFLTGTDEHGQKAEKSASERGVTPQALADEMVGRYHALWKSLGISHDDFIRTTEDRHQRGAQEIWRRMAAAGDVYKSAYSGPYCVGCEAFFPESQLVDGKCPEQGHPVEILEEESYFFRLSKYQQPLLDLYRANPRFVTPASRLNEVASFVEMGLEDLSISRTKLRWGVPVPGDDDHVMYVWIDALSNYVTALGFGPDSPEEFSRFWPDDLHVIGKDILRFHAVYWPAFLMSAGLPLPRRILAHGWWLRDSAKMSKTKGNVAAPGPLIEWFGADALRYFLLREIQLGADGNYSEEALVDRMNADLANDLGNTLSRVTKLVTQSLDGAVPAPPAELALRDAADAAWRSYLEAMEDHAVQDGLRAAWDLISATNKHLVGEEPWHLAKDPERRGQLEAVMHESAEALRHVAVMVSPTMPTTAREIWSRLGLDGDPSAAIPFDGDSGVTWGFPRGGPVTHADPLFPRIDKKKFFPDPKPEPPAAPPKSAKPKEKASVSDVEGTVTIGFEDFMKVALRSARVKDCRRHENADRLLVLDLDDGSGEPRTICAGVAAWYAPEDLAGKTIAIVANLAPRKLRGVESQGMLLAANYTVDGEERVRVIELPDDVPPGAEVR